MPPKTKPVKGKKSPESSSMKSRSKDLAKKKKKASDPVPSDSDEDAIPRTELYSTNPFDYVLLLKCKEATAVIQGCDILYEYIIKYPDFGHRIIGAGAVESLLNGRNHRLPYYNGTRYRFLSKLYEMYPEVRQKINDKLDFLRMAMKNAAQTDDVPLLAYSLLYCSKVTENIPDMLCEFIELYGAEIFFKEFLPNPDIDVKHNTLMFMKNFLDNEKTILVLIEAHSFSFVEMVDQIGCPYPAIQNAALDVIIKLLNFKEKEGYVQKKFINAGGISVLLQLLNVFAWRDIHTKVLGTLRILFRTPDYYKILYDLGGVDKMTNYVNFIIDDDLIEENLKTLLLIARNFEGRMIMSNNTATIDMFIEVLKDGSEASKLVACEAIRLLTEGNIQLSENDLPKVFASLIVDEENSLELRCCCACTLSALARSFPTAKLELIKKSNFFGIVKILEKPLKLTADCTCLILETISTLLSIPVRLKKLLSLELSQNVMAFIDDDALTTNKTQMMALEVLTWTLMRQVGRDWFIGLHGVSRIMKLLYRTTDPGVLNNVGLLLRMVVEKDPIIGEMFYKEGLVKWLIENKHLWKTSPRLETATQIIFHHEPSLKVEYWGRLDVEDVTSDGFFFCRMAKNETSVHSSDIWREDTRPARPVYTVQMGMVATSNEDSLSLLPFDEMENPEHDSEKHPNVESRLSFYAKNLISIYRKKSEEPEPDIRLSEMYNKLREQLKDIPSSKHKNKFSREWIEERVGAIASVVDNALSGRYGKSECTYHTLELHIQELKEELKSSVIPLGRLEVGLKLERALLFKVLADRLSVPCALVRGLYAVAWIEVVAHFLPSDLIPELPAQKVVTTHLVDLVNQPGRLVALDTQEARNYCGHPMPGVIERLPRHLAEKKPYWMIDVEKLDEFQRHIEMY